MKKATLQDIANSLNISRTSVWKVFGGHDGVSDELRQKVIEKAQELNYNLPREFISSTPKINHKDPVNISIAVCRPETSLFWMTIIHEIAKELSKHNVNLMYTYLPSFTDNDYELPLQLINGAVHGIIVMNVYNKNLIHLISKLSVPKVYMDTANTISPEDLNGDLILAEGKSCISKITEHLISQNKKNLGFIGDINYARTNFERYLGFMETTKKYKLPVRHEFCFTGSIGIDTYESELDAFLDRLKSMPDAFVCVSDFVASLLWQLLRRRGYEIPGDITITGFDGNIELPITLKIPTVQVFNKDLGIRLASQVLYRIHHPQTRYELTYISSEVLLRC